jgi:glycosyltransferase involved in cell wall biosynthesis
MISVIIPTFRRVEPLLQTPQDLLRQDYPDFEIIAGAA